MHHQQHHQHEQVKDVIAHTSKQTKNALLFQKIPGFQQLVLPYIPKSHSRYQVILNLHKRSTEFVVSCLIDIFPDRGQSLEDSVRLKVDAVLSIDVRIMRPEHHKKFFEYIRFFMALLDVEIRQSGKKISSIL